MTQEHQAESFPASIAGFRILRRLATGGTSDVLLAQSTAPKGAERVVVLKLLLARYRNDPKFERMFAREATAYARLNHPSIVKLYDFFSTDTRHGSELVMVLEYVDGVPLSRLRGWLAARGEPLDDRAAVFLAGCVFAALGAAHTAPDPDTGAVAPVIHRDINPSNVLIPWDGNVKLTDFGIAKVTGVTGDTKVGRIKGTFGYMAPEQVRGETTSTHTDVYAASLMLWELLARRRAIQHQALSELEALRAMAHPSLVSLDVLRPELPVELRKLVARGLEPDPKLRDLTAHEAAAALGAIVPPSEGRGVLAGVLGRMRGDTPTLDDAGPRSLSLAPPTVPQPPLSESDFAETNVSVNPHLPERPAPAPAPNGARPLPRFPTEPDAQESSPSSPALGAPSRAVSPPRPQTSVGRSRGGLTSRTLAFGDKLPGATPSPVAAAVAPASPRPPSVAPPAMPRSASSPPPGTPRPPSVAPPVAPSPPRVASTAVPRPEGPAPAAAAPLAGRVPQLDESRPDLGGAGAPAQAAAGPAAPVAGGRSVVSPFAATALAGLTGGPGAAGGPTTAPLAPPLGPPPPPALPPGQAAPPAAAFPVGSPPAAPPFEAGPPPVAAPAPAEPGRPVWYVASPAPPPVPNPRLASMIDEPGGARWALIAFAVVFIGVLGIGGALLLRAHRGGGEPVASSTATVAPPTLPSAHGSVATSATSVPASTHAGAASSARPPTSSLPTVASASASPLRAAPTASAAEVASAAAVPSAGPATKPGAPTPTVATAPSGGGASSSDGAFGTLRTGRAAATHRIYVDGHVVGEGTGSYRVRCGTRAVRVGSSGHAHPVEVPCGGTVDVP